MKIKKIVSAMVVSLALVSTLSTTAFAHGHSGGSTAKVSYSTCTVDNCNLNYKHAHDGKYYYAHSLTDGHDYHVLCSVANCTLTNSHTHDGVNYFGHNPNDGHTTHSSNGHH